MHQRPKITRSSAKPLAAPSLSLCRSYPSSPPPPNRTSQNALSTPNTSMSIHLDEDHPSVTFGNGLIGVRQLSSLSSMGLPTESSRYEHSINGGVWSNSFGTAQVTFPLQSSPGPSPTPPIHRLSVCSDDAGGTDDTCAESPQPEGPRLLGQGAQGSVYREVQSDGRVIAVKRIIVNCWDEKILATTSRELLALKACSQHPSKFLIGVESIELLSPGDSGASRDKSEELEMQPELVLLLRMELMQCHVGQLQVRLSKELLKTPFTTEYRWELINALLKVLTHDVLEGLLHMHVKLQRCHNDIKPENILLAQDGRAFKIADFGCTKGLKKNKVGLSRKASSLPSTWGSVSDEMETLGLAEATSTEALDHTTSEDQDDVTGTVIDDLGTQHYKSPERWHLNVCSPQSDVWSLGMTLVELAAKFDPSSPPAVIASGSSNSPHTSRFPRLRRRRGWKRRVAALLRSVDFQNFPDLHSFLCLCLAPNPARRAIPSKLFAHPWVRVVSENEDLYRTKLQALVAFVKNQLGEDKDTNSGNTDADISRVAARLVEHLVNQQCASWGYVNPSQTHRLQPLRHRSGCSRTSLTSTPSTELFVEALSHSQRTQLNSGPSSPSSSSPIRTSHHNGGAQRGSRRCMNYIRKVMPSRSGHNRRAK